MNIPLDSKGPCADFRDFLVTAPSSYHAVAEVSRRLQRAGFSELQESERWGAGTDAAKDASLRQGFVRRDGALIAWCAPEKSSGSDSALPLRMFAAHTDSPGFKLKPKATIGNYGWLQAGVEVYGGPLLNSWLDRELKLAGRLVTAQGEVSLVETEALLRFPQLAVHLDRAVNAEGLRLDPQQHLRPIWGTGRAEDADLLAAVAEYAGIDADQIAGYDLFLADCQPPEIFARGEFLAASRLDNLLSVYAGLEGLLAHAKEHETAQGRSLAILAIFDHEEVGSATASGAAGSFLADTLARFWQLWDIDTQSQQQALANSLCASSDVGHAIHPNYPERHDPANQPLLNAGLLLKINANARYATDGVGAAVMAGICDSADIPYQEFVSHNGIPCGSTVGPFLNQKYGIRTLDIGAPVLSMHSVREMCGVTDIPRLAQFAQHFYAY